MFTPWDAQPEAKQRVAGGWYRYFAQQLNLSSKDWGGGLLRVMTYNYDRSLEHFLFTILRSTCKESERLCWEIFQQIPIIHVYGELGPYNPAGDGLRYGSSLNIEIAREAAKNIRIMHEAKNEGLVEQSKEAVKAANVVCFLGSGYHAENIAPLDVHSGVTGKKIIGTALNLTLAERDG